jgi:hypothetical protein
MELWKIGGRILLGFESLSNTPVLQYSNTPQELFIDHGLSITTTEE